MTKTIYQSEVIYPYLQWVDQESDSDSSSDSSDSAFESSDDSSIVCITGMRIENKENPLTSSKSVVIDMSYWPGASMSGTITLDPGQYINLGINRVAGGEDFIVLSAPDEDVTVSYYFYGHPGACEE